MSMVSIIVPVYNAEKTIGRCIESIINQTYSDFELLLMDDGSKDGTAALLDQYAAQDVRIRVIHKANSGVSDTRNQALSLAKGDYIQFLDADDWITPDATRLFVRAMEDNEHCDMVIADFYRVIGERMSQKGDIEEEKLISREEFAEYMMRNPADFYYGVLWNKFFRRSIIAEYELQMDTKLSWAEDFIFNMEYILRTDKIYVLKAPVYYYVKTEGSLVAQGSTNIAKVVQMKLNVIEYYSSFYKDIYKGGGYYMRSPVIYSFLLNFAKDGGVSIVAPDKKLGRDRIDVRFSEEAQDNPFVTNYYEDRMLERVLERFMAGNDLEEPEAQILLYLKLAGGTASLPEIRNFTGLSARAASGSVQKLIRRKLAEKVKTPKARLSAAKLMDEDAAGDPESLTGEVQYSADSAAATKTANAEGALPIKERPLVRITFGEESLAVQDSLERIFRDADELQMRGFSEEEMAVYRKLRSRVTQNVRSAYAEPAIVMSKSKVRTESKKKKES